jgi:anti-sigma B factor antagonist
VNTATNDAGPSAVVAPAGELDLAGHAPFRDSLLEACAAGNDVVLDLSHVTFMDSSAVGLIVGAAKRCRENGTGLRIVKPSASVLRVLRLTGVQHLVPIDDAS